MIIDTQTIENIKQEEIDFPKRFASFVKKEYGVLYYMEDNKDSYDGNHACIYPEKIDDLGNVLEDITEFYSKLGIKASIYHPYVKNYFSENESILQIHGYEHISQPDHRVMLLTAENNITHNSVLEISVSNK